MIDVKAIRKKVGLTQEECAPRFSVKLASLRDWEQGRYAPDQTARLSDDYRS
ncbi:MULTISPECIES: helix-turn-helix domain-containing protein [Bradyrhizobium]|uniref:helix-turn-helix domain-containing protein n=1 Tax=Bradyrhizobium TaxID=374 RepID=UPI000A985A78